MERLSTGIYGLDEHLEGGFPVPALIFVKGAPGAGKTTFGVQSLFHGAEKGQVGMYVTGVSEPIPLVKKYLSIYGFFQEAPIKDGRIQFWDLGETLMNQGTDAAIEAIRQIIKAHKPSRLVMDPLPPMYNFPSVGDYRKFLFRLFNELRTNNVVTLVLGEKDNPDASGLEEYMADGVILLDIINIDNPLVYKNVMRICKMRGTNHIKNLLSVELTKQGMKVDRLV